jgi:hypothetical protein
MGTTTIVTWSDFPLSIISYAVCSTLDHLSVFVLGLIFIWGARRMRGREARSDGSVSKWVLFNLCLFAAAAIVAVFWDVLIYGRFYPVKNYLSDFSPFVPSGFEARASLLWIWLSFSSISWSLAFLTYRMILKVNRPNQPLQPTPTSVTSAAGAADAPAAGAAEH